MGKRIFIIVLDSFGIGQLPDAAEYGDAGSNTLAAVSKSKALHIPNLAAMGLYNIAGAAGGAPAASPTGAFCRMAEESKGKDTTTGHWELAGIVSPTAMPTFPEGFPLEVIRRLEEAAGRKVLCNMPYSGTQVIADYGKEHLETGALIVYTSADSVMQIAAHEALIPIQELYRICEAAREIMQGPFGVGRIIARPFAGEVGAFVRTTNRHDFSLPPTGPTMLDYLQQAGFSVLGVGKIYDIFAGRGVTSSTPTTGNNHGMEVTLKHAGEDFTGLCFVNLVDFDMLYGHRNNVDGYAKALTEFDEALGGLLPLLREEDLLFITADHGCDPSTPSTDHSREYVPLLAYGARVCKGVNLGTRKTFSDLAATVQEYFALPLKTKGTSFLKDILR